MAVSGVSSLLAPPPQSSSSSPAGATSSQVALNQQQFLQLLTAQLKSQDPLNPVSGTDFTSQLAQLSTLSGIEQLNTSIQQMLQLQQLSQGAALIGKTVTYAQSGASLTGQGVVQGVSLQNGKLQLQVGNQQVPIEQIRGIANASS